MSSIEESQYTGDDLQEIRDARRLIERLVQDGQIALLKSEEEVAAKLALELRNIVTSQSFYSTVF